MYPSLRITTDVYSVKTSQSSQVLVVLGLGVFWVFAVLDRQRSVPFLKSLQCYFSFLCILALLFPRQCFWKKFGKGILFPLLPSYCSVWSLETLWISTEASVNAVWILWGQGKLTWSSCVWLLAAHSWFRLGLEDEFMRLSSSTFICILRLYNLVPFESS